MRIVEVIIDVSKGSSTSRVATENMQGFKSYAVRTVISGWYVAWNPAQRTGNSIVLIGGRDESFNSITGLNGSGKSNILDSICFVLGITNMSTVRAQNLQVHASSTTSVGECQLTRFPS